MTREDSSDRTETGQTKVSVRSKGLSRDHADFWGKRLKKRSYRDRQGNAVEVAEWQVRLFHGGKEQWLNLGTGNKGSAAGRARDAYVMLQREGWAAMLSKFRPDSEVAEQSVTVGSYLDAVKATSLLRETTFAIYGRKFMTLLGGTFGIKGTKAKFDYVNGGREEWIARLRRIQLNKITDAKVERWRVAYLKAAESKSPLAYRKAKVTINSVLRGSKALFAPSVVKNIKLALPSPLPLAGVDNIAIERTRYRSTIDAAALLIAAKAELAETQPECYKAFLLALTCGLRRSEIDSLRWDSIDFRRHTISVETSDHASVKTASSENEVDCDPAMLEVLKGYMGPGCGPFVIQSANEPQQQRGASARYRADKVFERLIEWLHGKGLKSRNAIHELRKECGSVIASTGGIFAASRQLRHSGIAITAATYLDKKVVVSFPMADLLKAAEVEAKAEAKK